MDTNAMEASLMECRAAYMNASILVRGQVAPFMEPMLRLMGGVILALKEQGKGGSHGNHA